MKIVENHLNQEDKLTKENISLISKKYLVTSKETEEVIKNLIKNPEHKFDQKNIKIGFSGRDMFNIINKAIQKSAKRALSNSTYIEYKLNTPIKNIGKHVYVFRKDGKKIDKKQLLENHEKLFNFDILVKDIISSIPKNNFSFEDYFKLKKYSLTN